MIYITGDKHGDYFHVISFCYKNNTTINDTLIILGDSGFNYFLDYRDALLKNNLVNLPITLFCIHGNHEERAENIKTYQTKIYHEGIVYYEKDYPNILFAKDGEIYDFDGLKTIIIGGAYSIDKNFRLKYGYNWYASEQLTEEEKDKIKKVLASHNNQIDLILSHTCPLKYQPKEAFLEGINQDIVDNSMELFLDEIDDTIKYQKWYCGHYHIDKDLDRIQFMMHDIEKIKIKEQNQIKKLVK